MHVLTKIFIVLVCLLAILIVPLVVVYAHNESSYKQRYEAALADAQAANARAASADALSAAEVRRVEQRHNEARATVNDLNEQKAAAEAELRRIEGELAAARALQQDVVTDLGVIRETLVSNGDLTRDLVADLNTLRGEITTIQRENVELDEALRDVSLQLESTLAANRALQEEIQRASEEKGQMLSTIQRYQEQFGAPGEITLPGATRGIIPPINLAATVIGVSETADRTLVEIEAGTRDGVEKDWLMTIGRGASLIGRLRIIEVDINRAVGELTLDDRLGTTVQIGDVAYASPNG